MLIAPAISTRRFTSRLALTLAMAAAAVAGGCNGGGGGGGGARTVDADASTVVVEPAGTRLANGTDAAPVVVTVLDNRGDPMPGLVVVLDATGLGNLLVQPTTPTDADGMTFGFLASTHAEAKVVGAVVNVTAGTVPLTATDSVTFVGDPSTISATLSAASAFPSAGVVADDSDVSTITVTVADAFGNPVSGQTVELASNGTSNTLTQPAATTDAAGMTTGTISTTVAETKTLTATINPGPSQIVVVQQPTVGFVGDASAISSGLSTASANPALDVVADGADSSTITVTVRDVNGNAVSGRTVQLATTGTNEVLTQPSSTTDLNGATTGTIVSTKAETKTLTATIDPGPNQVVLTQQPTVGFIADASTISATLGTVSATPLNGIAADGTTTASITVQIFDANGNPVPGQTVQLAATGSGNTLTQPPALTDADGFAFGSLASTTAEDKTITATVNPGANQVVLLQQATVTFSANPGTISGGLSTVSVVPSSGVVANGVDFATITVTVVDANSNPVSGQTVMLGATGANNVLGQPAATTDANGVATGTIASTSSGTKTITATVNPGANQVIVAQQPTVGFVGDATTIDAALTTATANPSSGVVADGTATSMITVTVRDANGNPVAGQMVQLAASGTSNSLTQPVATTDASGVATGTIASTMAETKTLTATVNPGVGQVLVAQQPTVGFIGDASTIDAALTTATANPTSDVVADGTAASTITVTVRDANGNPVAGQMVQLASSGSSNSLTQPAATTDASGVATGTIASTMAETKTLTATVNPGVGQVVVAQQPTVAFIGDASTIDAALTTATANPTSDVVADGTATSMITVTVRDANGNPVAGQTVQLASNGTSNSLTQPAATTDTSGVATGTIASTMAETKTLTATVNPGVGQVVVAQQPTVGFIGDPATIDPTFSTASANPTTNVLADGSTTSTITVTVLDVNGNPVSGQTVQLAASGASNSLTQPGATTDLNGEATGTIASTMAETKTITATVNPGLGQMVVAMQPTVDFVANPATIDPVLTSATANPTANVLADGTTTSMITVTVLDANGNAVAGQAVQLTSTGTGNTLTQPAGPTDASGMATGTIASTTPEMKTITATVNPGLGQVVVAMQPTVDFVAVPPTVDPALSTASATPSVGLNADGIDASTITVTVRDPAGIPIPGMTVALASTGTGNTLTQPASATDAFGVATGTIASTVTETKTITVTVNPGVNQVVLVQQPTVTFGGDPTQIDAANSSAVASPSSLLAADGVDTSTITVTVRDVNGIGVAGQTVVLAATGSANTLVQPAAVTNGAGQATGTLKSTAAEPKTLTATINPGPNQVVVAQQPVVTFTWNPTDARYVRVTGSDAAGCLGGTTPSTAWRTVSMAASCAPPGTTVYVGAGVFTESVMITQSGTAADPIRFVADTAGVFTGDAGAVVVDGGGLGEAFQLDGVSWVEVVGFEVTGSGTSGGIHVGDGTCSNVTLRDNRVYGNPYGIYVRNAASATIEHNSISNNAGPGGDGIVVRDSNAVTVRDNLVYNNGRTGIDVLEGSLGVVVDANTIYQNQDDQITIDGSGNTVTLTNNVIALGAQNGVTLFVGSNLTSSFNDVWGQSGAGWNGAAAGLGDVSVDPGFVDPDGADNLLGGTDGHDDDFHLDPTLPSPVLDSGSAAAGTIATADGLTLADRTSRPDGTLDGSSPDGATLNLGFHYPVAGDAQPSLAAGDVRITYGEGTMRQPRRRLYDDLAGSWTAEGSAPPTVDTIRWVLEKLSPLASGEELVGMLAGTPSGGRIDLLRWSGQAWSRELRSIAITSGEVGKRGFDFEYEALSGDVMIVYSVNTSTPVYRTRTNAGWSDEMPLPLNDGAGPNPDVNTGLVHWLEVEPRPGTNEIAVAYSDGNRDLVALVWDGTQWLTSTAHVLSTDLWTSDSGGVIRNRAFDIAYEGTTGGLIAAWSRSTSGGIWYSRKGPGSSSYSTHNKIPSVPNYQPNFVDLGAERGTSRMAVCAMDIEDLGTPERLALATWNGTAWVNGGAYDSASANLVNTSDGDFPCAIGWLGTTGVAVCTYADDAAGTLDWMTWVSGSGWVVQPDVAVPGKGFTDSTRIAWNALGHLTTLVSDSTGKLWAMRYDGTSWTVTNGGAELETGISSNASVPFDAVQKNP